jgi:hypothetical protein
MDCKFGSSEGVRILAGYRAELMVEEIEAAQFLVRMGCGNGYIEHGPIPTFSAAAIPQA